VFYPGERINAGRDIAGKTNVPTGEKVTRWGYDKKSRRNCRQKFVQETETSGFWPLQSKVTVIYLVKICDFDFCKWTLHKYRSKKRTWGIWHTYKWIIKGKECVTQSLEVARKKITEFPEGVEIDWQKVAEIVKKIATEK
jgi:hypothetical protein